jgi:hypothetical protein
LTICGAAIYGSYLGVKKADGKDHKKLKLTGSSQSGVDSRWPWKLRNSLMVRINPNLISEIERLILAHTLISFQEIGKVSALMRLKSPRSDFWEDLTAAKIEIMALRSMLTVNFVESGLSKRKMNRNHGLNSNALKALKILKSR